MRLAPYPALSGQRLAAEIEFHHIVGSDQTGRPGPRHEEPIGIGGRSAAQVPEAISDDALVGEDAVGHHEFGDQLGNGGWLGGQRPSEPRAWGGAATGAAEAAIGTNR